MILGSSPHNSTYRRTLWATQPNAAKEMMRFGRAAEIFTLTAPRVSEFRVSGFQGF